ncbi:MAG: hypothetical protein ACKOC6_03585 [bacterium]
MRNLTLTLAIAAVSWLAVPAQAAVTAALVPANQTVTPGSDFDVFFDVTAAGSSFNGFDLVVSWDPARLTLLPTSPTTAQQGCLMTGTCSASCGSTFHRFSSAGDSAVATSVLLCNGVSLTGPGRLYKLRFRAANVVAATAITVRRASFYNAGLNVSPVNSAGCNVGIGVTTGVEDGVRPGLRLQRDEPNPAHGRVQFRSEDDHAGLVAAEVLDLQGRVRHRMAPVWVGARGGFTWDGRDLDGGRLPAGLYLVRIRRGGSDQTHRVTLLP